VLRTGRSAARIARAEGISQTHLAELPAWSSSDLFDSKQRAVLALADAMTREVHVPDSVFASVRAHLDDRSIVELGATVTAYNMVSRFLEALQIQTYGLVGSLGLAAHEEE
jgi:alkylhydroperoxidase family enzyme